MRKAASEYQAVNLRSSLRLHRPNPTFRRGLVLEGASAGPNSRVLSRGFGIRRQSPFTRRVLHIIFVGRGIPRCSIVCAHGVRRWTA